MTDRQTVRQRGGRMMGAGTRKSWTLSWGSNCCQRGDKDGVVPHGLLVQMMTYVCVHVCLSVDNAAVIQCKPHISASSHGSFSLLMLPCLFALCPQLSRPLSRGCNKFSCVKLNIHCSSVKSPGGCFPFLCGVDLELARGTLWISDNITVLG